MIEAIVKSEVPQLRERMAVWSRMVAGQLLKDVAELTADQARGRVERSKVSPDGASWPPRKSGGDHPLLVKTGAMLRSIRKRRRSAMECMSGVAKDYAKFHHTETPRMAARPFVGVGREDSAEIESLIDTFVELRF